NILPAPVVLIRGGRNFHPPRRPGVPDLRLETGPECASRRMAVYLRSLRRRGRCPSAARRLHCRERAADVPAAVSTGAWTSQPGGLSGRWEAGDRGFVRVSKARLDAHHSSRTRLSLHGPSAGQSVEILRAFLRADAARRSLAAYPSSRSERIA